MAAKTRERKREAMDSFYQKSQDVNFPLCIAGAPGLQCVKNSNYWWHLPSSFLSLLVFLCLSVPPFFSIFLSLPRFLLPTFSCFPFFPLSSFLSCFFCTFHEVDISPARFSPLGGKGDSRQLWVFLSFLEETALSPSSHIRPLEGLLLVLLGSYIQPCWMWEM